MKKLSALFIVLATATSLSAAGAKPPSAWQKKFSAACGDPALGWCAYDTREKLAFPMKPKEAREAVEDRLAILHGTTLPSISGVQIPAEEGTCLAIGLAASPPDNVAGFPHVGLFHAKPDIRVVPETIADSEHRFSRPGALFAAHENLGAQPGGPGDLIEGQAGCYPDSLTAQIWRSEASGAIRRIQQQRLERYIKLDNVLMHRAPGK